MRNMSPLRNRQEQGLKWQQRQGSSVRKFAHKCAYTTARKTPFRRVAVRLPGRRGRKRESAHSRRSKAELCWRKNQSEGALGWSWMPLGKVDNAMCLPHRNFQSTAGERLEEAWKRTTTKTQNRPHKAEPCALAWKAPFFQSE